MATQDKTDALAKGTLMPRWDICWTTRQTADVANGRNQELELTLKDGKFAGAMHLKEAGGRAIRPIWGRRESKDEGFAFRLARKGDFWGEEISASASDRFPFAVALH